MRIAICEDEAALVDIYATFVEEILQKEGCSFTIDRFLCAAELDDTEEIYDLVLLDCELPDDNGLCLAKRLKKRSRKTCIIIVTGYEKYVYESFEAEAFRFLLKPLTMESLQRAILSFLYNRGRDTYIRIPQKDKSYRLVNVADIMYIEAAGKNVVVRLCDSELQATQTVSEFETELQEFNFFRTHRRFIVNLSSIDSVQQNTILLVNGERVQVSKRVLPAFNRRLHEYIKISF